MRLILANFFIACNDMIFCKHRRWMQWFFCHFLSRVPTWFFVNTGGKCDDFFAIFSSRVLSPWFSVTPAVNAMIFLWFFYRVYRHNFSFLQLLNWMMRTCYRTGRRVISFPRRWQAFFYQFSDTCSTDERFPSSGRSRRFTLWGSVNPCGCKLVPLLYTPVL